MNMVKLTTFSLNKFTLHFFFIIPDVSQQKAMKLGNVMLQIAHEEFWYHL